MILYIKVTFLSGAKSKGITMNKFKITRLLFVLFAFSLTYAQVNNGLPTEEQVAKLAAAAWKERPQSLDVTLYLELTTPTKPFEQIRSEVEKFVDEDYERMGLTKESLKTYEKERRKKTIEINVNWRVRRQQFPRLIKKRIRISGNNQRTDSVTAEPGKQLESNMPFEHTYVNFGKRDSENFYSFHYAHKIKSANIEDKSGWAKRDPAQFAYLPTGISLRLKSTIGIKVGEGISAAFIPDPNRMQDFAEKGILVGGLRLAVEPDPNSPDSRDRIEIKDPNWASGGIVLICDRNDYSRIYYFEYCVPESNDPLYTTECSNFDSQGFPRNITETKYDRRGNLKEKSVYTILEVHLNTSIPDELFRFQPPPGYKVKDIRSEK